MEQRIAIYIIQMVPWIIGRSASTVVKCSSSRPPVGVLGMTPPTNFHICLSKCLLVLEYCKGITQFYLDSQLQLPIQKPAIFIIWKSAYFASSPVAEKRAKAELC